MHCPYCNKKPNQIDEYVEQARIHQMSAENYVRMDEGTFDLKTNLFCCTECYIKIGMPLNAELHQAFMRYRATVIELEGARE